MSLNEQYLPSHAPLADLPWHQLTKPWEVHLEGTMWSHCSSPASANDQMHVLTIWTLSKTVVCINRDVGKQRLCVGSIINNQREGGLNAQYSLTSLNFLKDQICIFCTMKYELWNFVNIPCFQHCLKINAAELKQIVCEARRHTVT